MAPSRARWRIGVDVGGTFTDLALHDGATGALRVFKVPTTPADPSDGVLDGMRHIAETVGPDFELSAVEHFLHGTTITTNALIQRSHPPCALLVTAGLRGAVQVQNQLRVGNLYDLGAGHPDSLVDEMHVFEVPERIDRDGQVAQAVDRAAVEAIGNRIRELGISSVAVCLLFSFANPAHETEVRDILATTCPDARVTLSSQTLPRIREWPRISTMLLNASLEPLLADYVARLGRQLERDGLSFDRLFLMESNCGLMPFSAVVGGGRAVHTLLSGPAAAVQAAIAVARTAGESSLLTLDVGGTSADVAFVQDGAALEVTEGRLVGHDIYVPMLDVTTIGAGGGTISRVRDGRLLVGPHSAGADPGPACYGRGGTEPTTTDADLVLGMLDPDYYLGGRMNIDVAAARAAVTTQIAEPLGLTTEDAATAMIRVNDVHMADAVRVFAAQRGVDLAEATLVACGGAGPLHAVGVAAELGIRRVLVPPFPGAFSAVGLLCADVVQDFVQSEVTLLTDENADVIEKALAALSGRATDALVAQGFAAADVRCDKEVDARYAGQGFELRLPVPPLPKGDVGALVELFHTEHERTYGHAARDEQVEIVSYRVRAVVEMPTFRPEEVAAELTAPAEPTVARQVYVDGGWQRARVVMRSTLAPGAALPGPVLVEQPDTTTFVPPGWRVVADGFGNLIIDMADAEAGA